MMKNQEKQSVPRGGSAAAGGFNFQSRVAAWIAVRILAEQSASPLWDLPEGTRFDWLRCETEEPVDDLMVGTSDGGVIFAQIKRSINISKDEQSEFAKATAQFVRQFLACQTVKQGERPWHRPLDSSRDRLVLITGASAPSSVRGSLRGLLTRIRQLRGAEPLDQAARNQQERHALEALTSHLGRAWQAAFGSEPSKSALISFLTLVHVYTLEVEEGERDERHAIDLLRDSILYEPQDATQAWNSIIVACSEYARRSSGTDRLGLQEELLQAGLQLVSPRSFRRDVEKLREYTRFGLRLLSQHAAIKIARSTIRIDREVVSDVMEAASQESILVIGEPGTGKSGVLHDLVKRLEIQQKDVVLLVVDRLAVRSHGELQRELDLDHNLISALRNWHGPSPGYLVIDALDAARADETAQAIRDLIYSLLEVESRWRVVASVRKFDLRYSHQLQRLFKGRTESIFRDNEFPDVRHVNVPPLSPDELKRLAKQSKRLDELVAQAPSQLIELLRTPFNIRLVAELLNSGAGPEVITPIQTRLGLLEGYWSERVLGEVAGADARESILRRLCESMLKARRLQAERSVVADPTTSEGLKTLLSSQVLVEWTPAGVSSPERHVLAFSHHVLFDYAVACLVFRRDPVQLATDLRDEPELVIVARPSLIMHFEYLWQKEDRTLFWDTTFEILSEEGVPATGQLIAPSVAARLATSINDLSPLLLALDGADFPRREAAEKCLRHLIGSALTEGLRIGEASSQDGDLWASLLEKGSRSLAGSVAYSLRPLLHEICSRAEALTSSQLRDVGLTARRFLQWAWEQSPRDGALVVQALTFTINTIRSDSELSGELIRRAIAADHMKLFEFEEMFAIARGIPRIISVDADLAADIYCAAFEHEETSGEQTALFSSQILPLISNRSQDYRIAQYELARHYPLFLQEAPAPATLAVISVVRSYVEHRHSRGLRELDSETFSFNGQPASFEADYSAIWDTGDTYTHDDALRVLDAFFAYLESLADSGETTKLEVVLGIVAGKNSLAVFWRRLLLFGARYPELMAARLAPLTWAQPILLAFDTSSAAGEFLAVAFSKLGREQRQRIEEAIMTLPSGVTRTDDRERYEHVRDRLLGCLDSGRLITPAAQERLEALSRTNAVPVNYPPFEHVDIRSEPYGEEELLADEGVTVAKEANRRVREFEEPLKRFIEKHRNASPGEDEINDILPALGKLWEVIQGADDTGVHLRQRDYAWGTLAEACSVVAGARVLDCHDVAGGLVRSILLASRSHPQPEPTEDNSSFEETPSWGKPAARIDAAAGLTALARHRTCVDRNVLAAVKELLEDKVPPVRFQVAIRLNALYETAREEMWALIEATTRREKSAGVLQGLLSGPISRLGRVDSRRIGNILLEILGRLEDGPGWARVRRQCVQLITGLYVWQEVEVIKDRLMVYVECPEEYIDEADAVVDQLREPLVYGEPGAVDSVADAVRSRGFELLLTIVTSAASGIEQLKEANPQKLSDWPEHSSEKLRGLYRLVNHAGDQLYFASGAFDQRRGEKGTDGASSRQQRFYREAAEVLEALAELGMPPTAHRLLEMLQFLMDVDPKGVFLRIVAVVVAAGSWGYQYETMAVELVVRIVERYLAEYRSLFLREENCRRGLIQILDTFVEAGWPAARQLTYQLDGIFR